MSASVGFPKDAAPVEQLLEAAANPDRPVVFEGLGSCSVATGSMERDGGSCLVVARAGEQEFSPQERGLLRSMARVLSMTLQMIERQRLLEHLSRIQRSISLRAPLVEVLDAIADGAKELVQADVVGLRILDPRDPNFALLVSVGGMPREMQDELRRTPITQGAGGRAIVEDRLVVMENYDAAEDALAPFVLGRLQIAMAVPVHENGFPVGSLTVGCYDADRRFSRSEQMGLAALGEHAGMALTDAKTVDAMREAQRSREMFLAMVSHELKTPLTVIMGNLRTLQAYGDDLPSATVDDLLRSGFERGRELEDIIDKLLQGTRAQLAGRPRQVRLRALLGEPVQEFRASRPISMLEVPPILVEVDPAAVRQILGVLLENAVSHSPSGSEIEVEAEEEAGQVYVRIKNKGSLPPELSQTDLFEAFHRGTGATSPGVGLGLHIASRVASSIGGIVDATSARGDVTFTLRFPQYPPDASLPLTGSPVMESPLARSV
jgi:signal transduction histidine kinase